MTPLTAAQEAGKIITLTQDVPWGTIAISLAVVLVAGLYAILALKGKAPGIKAKMGDKEVELGDNDSDRGEQAYIGPDRRDGACTDLDPRDLYTPLLVTKRRSEANNAAWARQKAHADELEDDFWPILDRRGCDTWQAEAACNRLHRTLYNAADQNHILDFVRGGQVDPDYLEDKVQSFRRRYDKLSARPGCTLPAFPKLAEEVRSLIAAALVRFGEIATEEEAKVEAFAEALKRSTGQPEVVRAIEEAARRGLPEVA